jgi:hypothetical protein
MAMPKLHQHENGYWFYAFEYKGVPYRKSTRTKVKHDAQRILDQVYTSLLYKDIGVKELEVRALTAESTIQLNAIIAATNSICNAITVIQRKVRELIDGNA